MSLGHLSVLESHLLSMISLLVLRRLLIDLSNSTMYDLNRGEFKHTICLNLLRDAILRMERGLGAATIVVANRPSTIADGSGLRLRPVLGAS